MNLPDRDNFQYDVTLSFAGEDRTWASQLAELLRSRNIKVFYDKFEEANLWGEDLYEYLDDVYSNRARYCIMFISENYAKKAWTNHERKSAQARAFRENKAYILPLRIDNTKIPGIPETIGYISLSEHSIEEVAKMVEVKLDKLPLHPTSPATSSRQTPIAINDTNIPMPRVQKQFTEREKDKFLKESLDFIRTYFRQGLTKLEAHHQEVEIDFDEIHKLKFVCKIYLYGNVKNQCKIWIGGMWSSNSICYTESRNIDISNDNSFNDLLSITDNGIELSLKPTILAPGFNQREETFNKEQAAEYLWKRFSAALEH